ncbi:protein kinase domain-containing protein [Streptomyces anulatus]|uniref:AbiJ-related protein n=1 Tax=Streptomyces anulatus TaxID=1892 RepID=UPI002257C51E|nr:protein kinase [Streptomyces anulatus]MCX4508169.1 protein kinase [Streptomyces anulatus]
MQFTVLPVPSPLPPSRPGEAYLVTDNWDDHHFKTTFDLFCPQERGDGFHNVGVVKIGRFGMTAPSQTPTLQRFDVLDSSFFSLGQSDAYYNKLWDLGADVQRTVLSALRDVSVDQDLYSRAKNEPVMQISLLRTLSDRAALAEHWGKGMISPATKAITEVTRRRLFGALRAAPFTWSGNHDEVAFLRRIYDLDRLPSFDPRFPTAERDIAQHRINNPGDWEDDWIFTDSRFALTDGPDTVLLRFLTEMINPAVRTDSNEVEYLLALINDILAPDGYQLRPASVISGYPLYEARRTSTVTAGTATTSSTAAPSDPAAAVPATLAPSVPDAYTAVRNQAAGNRDDYRRAQFRLPGSNMADVFDSVHKATNIRVAVKQLHGQNPHSDLVARMRREIEIGQWLNGHPHAMPILDHNEHTWFVMPWADGTAVDYKAQLQDPNYLRPLVDALTSVLAAAHQPPTLWIHRDIKPSNILLLEGRWVLADWGAVRRPPGQTTKVDRTRLGIGTEGFTAPEIFTANRPEPTSDIYSVGRVIAWALTGTEPRANVELLPNPGPWRNIVRKATNEDPSRRPQTIADLVTLIEHELVAIPEDPHTVATNLVHQATINGTGAAEALLTLLTDHPGDYELYVDVLTQLPAQQAYSALTQDLSQARSVLRALAGHVNGGDKHTVQWGQANKVAKWLCQIAEQAALQQQWDLLEEATQTMCIWDGAWDQYNAQDQISPWLAGLKGDAAAAVAGILSQNSDSASHFSHLYESRTIDVRIRMAVKPPQP